MSPIYGQLLHKPLLAFVYSRGVRGMKHNRDREIKRRVRFGRKLKLTAHQQQEALARREAGEALAEIWPELQCQSLNNLKVGATLAQDRFAMFWRDRHLICVRNCPNLN